MDIINDKAKGHWFGRTSAEMRDHCVRWFLEPIARLLFATAPEAQSVVLSVARYYADEGDDATHLELSAGKCDGHNDWGEFSYGEENPLPACIETVAGDRFYDDSNGVNIVAFASQCEDASESFRPWAIARRKGDHGCTTEILGQTLDPRFENNFNYSLHSLGERHQDMKLSLIKALIRRGRAADSIYVIVGELREAIRSPWNDTAAGALEDLASRLDAAILESIVAEGTVFNERAT